MWLTFFCTRPTRCWFGAFCGWLEIPGAFLAGLVFGIHPTSRKSVAWISELKNVLCMFFFLLSLLCFFERRPPAVERSGRIRCVARLFFAGVALQNAGRVLAGYACAVRVVAKFTLGKRTGANLFGRTSYERCHFFSSRLILGLVTIWFQNRGIGEEEIVLGPLSRRLTNAGLAVWWYAKQIFLPVRLMAVYPRWRF